MTEPKEPDYEELAGIGHQPTDLETALTHGQVLEDTVPKVIFYDNEVPGVDITERVPPQGPAVGSDFPTDTVDYVDLTKVQRAEKAFTQQYEANKVAEWFTTEQGKAIPDSGQAQATAVQVSGRKENRSTIMIYNTGVNPVYVGKSSGQAQNNGFTLLAGAAITVKTHDAVYVWAPLTATSTVDIMETFYETKELA